MVSFGEKKANSFVLSEEFEKSRREDDKRIMTSEQWAWFVRGPGQRYAKEIGPRCPSPRSTLSTDSSAFQGFILTCNAKDRNPWTSTA